MLTCINKNFPEYQTLKNKSGIQETILDAVCRNFLDKYNRFPHLDELPNANSEPYLKKTLNIDKYNGTLISKVLDTTGKNTIEEANASINDEYRDLEVKLVPIEQETLVEISHKPTAYNFDNETIQVDSNPNSHIVFNNLVQKLSDLYGIKFNTITDAELNSEQWKNLISDVGSVNSFIYNGEIYINLDKNSVDSPIHEMMHILIGSMRFTNPSVYQQLVDSVQNFPNYQNLIGNYSNRTRNDVNEEIFVTEVSKYMSGLPSNIGSLDSKLQYEIAYNIKRILDIALMGQDSVKALSQDKLAQLSFKQLAQEVNSSIMTNKFFGTLNVEGSALHRKLNNIKSDLIKQQLLKEVCD